MIGKGKKEERIERRNEGRQIKDSKGKGGK